MTNQAKTNVSLEGMKTPMEKLSDEIGLPLSYTNDLVRDVTVDILLSMQAGTTSQTKKAKVQEALKSLYPNGTFLDDGHVPAPMLLLGCPGHGKTSVLRAASRDAAALMGLNFKDNPPSDEPITENDFILLSVEFAGQNSALMIRGIPFMKRDEQTDVQYMDFLKERAFANMEHAGGGTLLLDDLANANIAMMNVALPILEERRFNRTLLDNFYVGATGNLGSLDGTKTSSYSSALLNRGKVILVRDKIEDLAARMSEKYGQDELGDCFFNSFMLRQGQGLIETVPKAGSLQPVATPRSLDKAIKAMRVELMKVGGTKNGKAALNRSTFDRNVGSLLGKEVSDSLVAHLNSAYEFADPAARMMILEGVPVENVPTLRARIENPNSLENIMFFEQFGQALADYASFRIKNGGDFKETVNRFATALYTMDGAAFTGALSLFKDRLVYRNPVYSMAQGGKDSTGKRLLTEAAYTDLIDLFSKHPDADNDHWNDVVSVLSESGLYNNAPGAQAARKRPVAKKKTP